MVGRALIAAEPDDFPLLRDAVHEAGSVYAYVAARSAAERLQGRALTYRFRTPRGEWVVRRYRRGGAVARVLGDRYVRLGGARPWRELAVSFEARARGVRTPRVVAAVVYVQRLFYRADLVTEYVPVSADLAELAFGATEQPEPVKLAAFRAAGKLVRELAAAGLVHPDLNLKNILIDFATPTPRAWVIDLDRARIAAGEGDRLWQRLQRSIAKWERMSSRRLAAAHAQALRAGFHG